MREIEIGKKYRHFKGQMYEVLLIAYDYETNNDENPRKLVVYKALYGDNLVWVRDYDMFASKVDRNKYPDVKQEYRFELVNDD